MPYELASGMKAIRILGTAQNLIRREPPQVGESLMSLSSGKVN